MVVVCGLLAEVEDNFVLLLNLQEILLTSSGKSTKAAFHFLSES